MEVNNIQPFEVVFTFIKHPHLGMLVEANAVLLLPNGDYSLTYQRIREKTTAYYRLNAEQTEAVNIIEDFEAEAIIKRFYTGTKKLRAAEFFNKHYNEDMHKLVRAFIEKRLVKVLTLIRNYPLFTAPSATEVSPNAVKYSEEPATVLFHFRRDETGTNYFATIKQGGEKVEYYNNDSEMLVAQPAWLLTPTGLYHFPKHVHGNKIKPFLTKKFIHVDPRNEDTYMEKFVQPLLENHDVYAKGFDIVTEQFQASPVLKLMTGFGEHTYLSLHFHYGNWNFPFHVNKKVNVTVEKKGDSYLFHRIRRSFNWENEKIHFLKELGLTHFEGSLFRLEEEAHQLNVISWINENAEELKRQGFEIQQDSQVVNYFLGNINLQLDVVKDNDWFDVRSIVHFGNFKIPFARLRKNILENKREFILPDGSVAVLPEEWFTQFARIAHFAEVHEDSFRLKNMHFSLLEDLGELIGEEKFIDKGWLENLDADNIPHFEIPEGLKADLRDYQHHGYNWMRFLIDNKIGALLADDMGLGKTVQTLAIIEHLSQQQRQQVAASAGKGSAADAAAMAAKKPVLILAPKSLLHNWKAEAEKFTPGLKVLVYAGIGRHKLLKEFPKYDVIVTSYGTMRLDAEKLEAYEFVCLVLDESQAIKNPASLTARNLQRIKASHRIALTGTPIENTLLDIWSQMHFLNPGLLGSYGYFDKQFIRPIEKKADQKKSEELRRILEPFILRRTKKQVAKELPEKIEKIHFCEMSEEQAALYEKVKSQYRNEILGHVQEMGIARSKLKILNGLMHLRQLALNPVLKDQEFEGRSGKDEEIRHMLRRAIDGDHKVLVFSQFVSYLSVFKEMLDDDGIPYAYLDGSTDLNQRKNEIDKFQNDPSIKVFLLSLRAGNSGINLTAADYVFLADPWWNPFTMKQAEDRAHRIGQDKTVFSYSFITRGTIEEKILLLQKRKTELAGSIIPDEENFFSSLDEKELEELFG